MKKEYQQNPGEEKYKQVLDYSRTIQGFNKHNGIVLDKISDNYAECRIELSEISFNDQAIAHGGLVYALADVTAGYATFRDDRDCVTLSSDFNFLRPATGAYIRAVGVPLKMGRKTAVSEVSVYDGGEKLVAKGTFTYCFTD
jgi:acyl-CoA thioesterase